MRFYFMIFSMRMQRNLFSSGGWNTFDHVLWTREGEDLMEIWDQYRVLRFSGCAVLMLSSESVNRPSCSQNVCFKVSRRFLTTQCAWQLCAPIRSSRKVRKNVPEFQTSLNNDNFDEYSCICNQSSHEHYQEGLFIFYCVSSCVLHSTSLSQNI